MKTLAALSTTDKLSKMSGINMEKLEEYVNEVLKEDLNHLEKHLKRYNDEIMEYVQLKNTIATLQENLAEGFKTQMDVGGNIFMQASVNELDSILVDVGLGYYVDFTLDEAAKFVNFKIKLLTKESEVVRADSIKKRAAIKLALICMSETQKMHLPEAD